MDERRSQTFSGKAPGGGEGLGWDGMLLTRDTDNTKSTVGRECARPLFLPTLGEAGAAAISFLSAFRQASFLQIVYARTLLDPSFPASSPPSLMHSTAAPSSSCGRRCVRKDSSLPSYGAETSLLLQPCPFPSFLLRADWIGLWRGGRARSAKIAGLCSAAVDGSG